MSPVFEEREPFVVPTEKVTDIVGYFAVGNRQVSIQSVKSKRYCQDNSLMDLVSHLGVATSVNELGVCEGSVYEMEPWDGLGYRCRVANRCTYGLLRPTCWVYDYDLWNFRWTDEDGQWSKRPSAHLFNNHAELYAYHRFGPNVERVVKLLGGCLKFKKYRVITNAVDYVLERVTV